jgi:hypothetical protein
VNRIRKTTTLAFALVAAAGLATGCSKSEDQPPAGIMGGQAPSSVSDRPPYRAITRSAWGRVTGSIDVDGGVTADTIVVPTHDMDTCGDSLTLRTLQYDDGVVGSIVWLEDVRSGKSMPLQRRYELLNEKCQLYPSTQAVVTGGTINLKTLDAVAHRIRLVKAPETKPRSIVSLYTVGQVVPVHNMLRTPGRISVTCDRHPWTHGWILIFDHPYFTQSGGGGEFALDSVPPGNYRLVAWHARYGSVEQPLTVTANGEAKASLKFATVAK